ncbi:hypothetical protein WR25_20785 [Diploscapter pachys]|uniref:Uncharacterized protein n=1 Tax=Diploscapter pachys TaxID=2018661 RepID=A0A2A2KDJ5_9BILA|nr:hypothetical protein WR25_20785 [Diploscapter pachys]
MDRPKLASQEKDKNGIDRTQSIISKPESDIKSNATQLQDTQTLSKKPYQEQPFRAKLGLFGFGKKKEKEKEKDKDKEQKDESRGMTMSKMEVKNLKTHAAERD